MDISKTSRRLGLEDWSLTPLLYDMLHKSTTVTLKKMIVGDHGMTKNIATVWSELSLM